MTRPDASLAANNTAKIYNDPTGKPYSQIGAKSARHLVQTIGPPPLVKDLPVPGFYVNPLDGKFKDNFDWMILDDQFPFPARSVPACQPLLRKTFDDSANQWERGAWDHGSRCLNALLRQSLGLDRYVREGWLD